MWMLLGVIGSAVAGGIYAFDKLVFEKKLRIGDTVTINVSKLAPDLPTQFAITDAEVNINALLKASPATIVEVKQVSQTAEPSGNTWRGLFGPGAPVVFNQQDVVTIIRNGKVIERK